MRRSDFHYELPAELIAREPPARRGDSRLLHLDATGHLHDREFRDLPQLLLEGDLLVLNDTRVVPARAWGTKETGGRVELLLERVLAGRRCLVQLRASKPPQPGSRALLAGGHVASFLQRRDGFWEVELDTDAAEFFERHGEMPLPPYLGRPAGPEDRERYQTVYAREPGAVAAPTAGLHFDAGLLDACRARGVEIGSVTLHVGAGTFQPVRVEDLAQHRMHFEQLRVGPAVCDAVARARRRGTRVVAVGTTVVRALESAAAGGRLEPFAGETQLFITPGDRFRVVDALVTNFHLPESTLLMLVCAFAGTRRVLDAYAHAVRERYRFFSYGDAMLVEPAPEARA